MNDEEFWFASLQSSFDFDDINNWSVNSDAFRRSGGFQGLDKFHSGGIHDCLEKDHSSRDQAPIDVTVPPSEDILLHKNVFNYTKKHYESTVCTTPNNTIKNILLGLNFSLEHHKTIDEKVALLELAIKSHDGNAITAVILFLRSTLKKSIFQHQILQHPEALHHYVCYLETDQEYDELSDILLMIGNAEDAAIMKYKAAIKVKDSVNKVKKLKNCLSTHFQLSSVPSLYVDCISEHISLLQRQLPIEEDDARQEHEGTNEMFKYYPREHTLFDVPVISTLFYCCIYHYKLSENYLASPIAIKKSYQLTDKQFMWTAIAALAQLQNWIEIENLFINKDWLGNTKMKCCIGFNKVVPLLANAGAPFEVLLKYIELVENAHEKLSLAKKCKFHKVVMKILLTMKDRQELSSYLAELSPKSAEYIEVEEVLRSHSVKWKN